MVDMEPNPPITTTYPHRLPGRALVVGGSGKTGRRVVERLGALGVDTRGVSRSTVPRFDWTDPTTWPAALDGVDAAYLTYYPDLALPGADEAIAALGAAAVEQGVRRVVLLSGRGEPGAQASEDALFAVAPAATVVRASWFMQNFSEHFLLEPVLEGVIAVPAGNVAEPFVDVEDIADVVVAALTTDGHAGLVHEVTGPRLLTFADVAAELSLALDRPISYLPVTPEEYAVAAVQAGVPAEEVGPLTDLFVEVLDGRNASVADGVDDVLGRPARDFTDYVRRTTATGVWSVANEEVAG
jgi:uncharacterized protein YbjT (DUF2867 family)